MSVGSRYVKGGRVKDWSWDRVMLSFCASIYVRMVPGHAKVQPRDGRVLTTQLYFPGEARNRSDGLFRKSLLMRTAKNAGWLAGRFDFVVD